MDASPSRLDTFYVTMDHIDIDSAQDQDWLIQEFMGEETALEKLFKSMDKDGDGTVTKEVTVIIVVIVIIVIVIIIIIIIIVCMFLCSNDRLYKNLNLKVNMSLLMIIHNIYEYLSWWPHFIFQEFQLICKNLTGDQVRLW